MLLQIRIVLMTFKDLKKRINVSSNLQQQTQSFDKLQNKPFWIWDQQQHRLEDIKTNGYCCFNHIIGLPTKDGLEKPIFDYQELLYEALLSPDFCNPLNHDFKDKHLWIKKATGLGITEFFLRFMAWLCLRDNNYRNSQMCIVTGPNIDIAIKLIKRMKGLFEQKLGLTFPSKETVLELNGCRIEAYPSNHIDAYRALDNPKFILLDEADFFRKGEQEDVRHVSERYIAKSNPYIVMVSTPNAPDGLFEHIEKEDEETCLYKRLLLDYTYGLGKIYTQEEIDKAKASPSFEREYNLKYLGLIGNVFHTKDIEAAIQKGTQYSPSEINDYSQKSMGIDPAFGSSSFGIVITQRADNQIQIMHAEEYQRPDFNQMLSTVWYLFRRFGKINKIYIDGSNPSFIRALKIQIGEDEEYEEIIKEAKSRKRNYEFSMDIVPVSFAAEHKSMLGNCKMLLEREGGYIAINPKFDKLITSLRTAVENDGVLDKEATSYDDVFDAFRLALHFYRLSQY
jgi:hypothetical protein